MRNIRFLITLPLVVLALVAGSAQAVTWTWTAGGATTSWTDPDNWNTLAGDPNIPGLGDYAGDDILVGIDNATLDLGATDVNIGSFTTKHRDTDNVTVQGTGTLYATEIFNSDRCGNLNFYPNLVVSGRIWNNSKGDIRNFYSTVTAGSLDLGASAPLFHQAVTITNAANGLENFYRSIATGGNNNWKFDDVINASKMRIWSDVVGQTAMTSAQNVNTLSGITGAVTVDAGGILNLVVAQNSYGGGVQINAGGLLLGDTGTATWGVSGANINIAENAVLAISAGTTPTEAALGLASGVKDALIWQGILDDGTLAIGDDGDSAYKGMAFGSFTAGDYVGKTLQAPVGAGNLTLAWLPGAPSAKPGTMTLESLDQTGVADIEVYGGINFKGGTLNATATADTVTTLNIKSHLADTSAVATLTSDFVVKDDQTFNFTGGGKVNVDPTQMHGQLTFSDRIMFTFTNEQFNNIATDPNTKLTFNAGTALSFGSGDVLALEQLSPGQLVVDPGAVLCLETFGNNNSLVLSPQFDITDANNPNLVSVMKSVNVFVKAGNNNYADMQGDGIQLGDGKYLIEYASSHKGLRMRADANHPNAMIHGAGPGTTMGIGSASSDNSDYLYVMLPIDAHGGTVLLNRADPITAVLGDSNLRYTGPVDNNLEIMAPIHNAAEVVVLNNNVQISDDSVDDGNLLGALLPIRVAGTGNLQFQHTADGDGFVVSNLDKTQISIDQGGRVYVNADMSINTMVLNSTYSAGNDGLQINDADDDLTITGKLSGNGAWGGSGQMIIDGSATVAPGNGVGELTGQNLTMASGATYEWQVENADGATPGTDWDLISAANIAFEGDWTLKIPQANLTGNVGDTTFVVATVTGEFTGFVPENVTLDLSAPGWTGGALAIVDQDLVLSGLITSLPGDADGDGDVDAADYIMIKTHFGGPPAAGTAGSGGDLDGDGTVDWDDLQTLMTAYNTGTGANKIPEPASLGLLALGALAVFRRRRK